MGIVSWGKKKLGDAVDCLTKQVGYGVVGDLNVLEKVTVAKYKCGYDKENTIGSLKDIQENLLMSDELKSLKPYGKSKIKNQDKLIKSYFDTQKALNKDMDSLIQSLEKANVSEELCRKKYEELKKLSPSESVSENWYSELNREYKEKVLKFLKEKMESEKEQLKQSVLDYFKKLGLGKNIQDNIQDIEKKIFGNDVKFDEKAKDIILEYAIKPYCQKLVEEISKKEGENFKQCYNLPYGDKKRKKLEDDIIKKITTKGMKKDFIKNLKKKLFSKNIGIDNYEWILYSSVFEYSENSITFGKDYEKADKSYMEYWEINRLLLKLNFTSDKNKIDEFFKEGLKRYSKDPNLKKLSDDMFKKQKEMSQKFEKSPERLKKSFECLIKNLNNERDFYCNALLKIKFIEDKINNFFKPIKETTYYNNFVKKVMSDGFDDNNFTSGQVFGYIYYAVVKNVKVELQKKIKDIENVLGNVNKKIKELSAKQKGNAKTEKELSNKRKGNEKTDKGIFDTILDLFGNLFSW